jgi:diguanylate cyclase
MNDLISTSEDELIFLDELDSDTVTPKAPPTWRIMIIDDDPDVHSATTFALSNIEIQQRQLSFLHAYSAAQARDILARETDIAIILLDVVMEDQDAGLQLVTHIRGTLGLHDVRIILRTGQPGYAPEIDAIRDYDINDYKTKSELTRTKLYTAITSAIRSYEQICAISAGRKGLESIVHASNSLMLRTDLEGFSAEVLAQMTDLLGHDVEGFVCKRDNREVSNDLEVIAATPSHNAWMEQKFHEVAAPQFTQELIERAVSEKRNIYQRHQTALYFNSIAQHDVVIYLSTAQTLNELDRRLLEVLYSNIAIGMRNVMLTSRLHDYAFYDLLTGLANRLKLLQTLNETLLSPSKNKSTLALIDIDHFAETNDALGHQFGDSLLFAVAQRLTKHFGEQCHLARVGNDTFALLGDDNTMTPQSILAIFNTPVLVDTQEAQLSATIGLLKLADYEGDGSDALKDTNIALKRAKMNQRASFAYFTRDMGVDIRERVRMMHALRTAFESDRLFLVYQPQIDMRDGHPIGAEALIRWRADNGMLIQPDQFIPIAEYSGMIVDIGEWVLRCACHELTNLRRMGYNDFQMSVNVSQAQFSHPQFMNMLERALNETRAPAHCLELEITESMAMKDPDLLIKTIRRVKQLGVKVSIDDFGTGFSSLSQLQKLDVDKLKIDRAFINEIKESADEGNIAKMVIQLGHSMNMSIIAEGVETQLQANTLLSFGCRYAQGYFYAMPMTKDDLHVWLNGQVKPAQLPAE